MVFVQQHELEHIYLGDDDLKSLSRKTNDLVEYLKFQAQRGDIESQAGSSQCYFHVRAVRDGKYHALSRNIWQQCSTGVDMGSLKTQSLH